MKKMNFCILILIDLIAYGILPKEAAAQDSLVILIFPSGRDIEIGIAASAEAQQNGYKYQYTISSSTGSEQDTWVFEVQGLSLVDSVYSPSGWTGDPYGIRAIVSWGAEDSAHRIAPGTNLGGFGFIASGPPSIQTYYAQGWFPVPVVEIEPDSIVNGDIIENSISGRTLGPRTPPTPFVALAFLDTLIAMKNEAKSLNWIQESDLSDLIDTRLSKARDHLESEDESGALEDLQAALSAVEEDCLGVGPGLSYLTSEACALLRYNIEYLMEQLE